MDADQENEGYTTRLWTSQENTQKHSVPWPVWTSSVFLDLSGHLSQKRSVPRPVWTSFRYASSRWHSRLVWDKSCNSSNCRHIKGKRISTRLWKQKKTHIKKKSRTIFGLRQIALPMTFADNCIILDGKCVTHALTIDKITTPPEMDMIMYKTLCFSLWVVHFRHVWYSPFLYWYSRLHG